MRTGLWKEMAMMEANTPENKQADLNDKLLAIIFSEKNMVARCRMLRLLIKQARRFKRSRQSNAEAYSALQTLEQYNRHC